MQGTMPARSQLWVVAGNSPASGCTTVAGAFTDLLKRHGQQAEFISASKIFDRGDEQNQFHSSAASDYSAIPVQFLGEINKVLHQSILYRYDLEANNEFLIVDMGSRISSRAIDLFLVADLPIFTVRPDARGIEDAKTFFKFCILKILDAFFDENHPQLRAVIADLEENSPFSAVVSRRIRTLQKLFPSCGKMFENFMQTFSPRLLVNLATPEKMCEFSDFYFREAAAVFPPGASVMGILHEFSLRSESAVHMRTHNGNVNVVQLGKIETIIRHKVSSLLHSLIKES
jgi:hypothetical protein